MAGNAPGITGFTTGLVRFVLPTPAPPAHRFYRDDHLRPSQPRYYHPLRLNHKISFSRCRDFTCFVRKATEPLMDLKVYLEMHTETVFVDEEYWPAALVILTEIATEQEAKNREPVVRVAWPENPAGGTINIDYWVGELEDEDDIAVEQLLNSNSTGCGTVLHLATKLGDADIVRTLLSAGADPGIHNQEGQTALDLATNTKVCDVFSQELLQSIAQSNIGRVCQLLASGVSVNLIDCPDSANTPLHWAACYANTDTVQCLISNLSLWCSVVVLTRIEDSWRHLADQAISRSLMAGKSGGTSYLLFSSYQLSIRGKVTSLEHGSSFNCTEERKASVNAVNTDGASPLHDALSRGEMSIVEELLEAGASTSIRPHAGKYSGKTIFELAKDNPNLIKLLEKHKDSPQMNGLPDDSLSKIDDNLFMQRSLSENSTASEHLSDSAHSTPKKVSHTEPPPVELTPVEVTERDASVSYADDSEEDNLLALLWPRPLHIVRHEGAYYNVPDPLLVCIAPSPQKDSFHASLSIWQQKREQLQARGVAMEIEPLLQGKVPTDVPHVMSEINPRLFSQQQAYRLSISESQVKVQAADEAGLFYATNTFSQLIRLCGEDGIPQLQIDDWPSVRDRGVLLDLSKGRIPKMESLLNLIKILASLKVNQVHLYMRFKAFSGREAKWQLPYPQSSILELDSVCCDHQVELLPVLDVAPSVGYLDLVSMRYSFLHFVQCFPSAGVLGFGPRLSSLLVDTAEEGVFTMDELGSILPVGAHQTAQLCAYVFHDLPGLLEHLPCNIMLAEYGFEATYDFETHCKIFTDYGIPFSVIPGTAAWNSLAGCPEAAVANISAAVTCAINHRALGVVTSHWAGIGHMTSQPISWLGFLTSAGLSWNPNIPQEFLQIHLSELLNEHVFQDAAGVTGQVVVELGRVETHVLRCSRKQQGNDHSSMPSEKGSTLYQLLSQPDQVELENLTPEVFQKTTRHIRKCVSELSGANLQSAEGDKVFEELHITGDLMLSACRVGRALVHSGRNPKMGQSAGYAAINMGVANLSPTQKTDLANRLLPQVETYRTAWLRRSLPQGLTESLAVLTTMLKQFIPQGHQHSRDDDGVLVTV